MTVGGKALALLSEEWVAFWEMWRHTLYKFATVSSGAGENAKLIYVNYLECQIWRCGHGKSTHQWIRSLPTQLLPQELNHSLKSVGSRNLIEILFHNRRISDRLESYDDLYLSWDWVTPHSRLYKPLEESFFLYDSSASIAPLEVIELGKAEEKTSDNGALADI